MKLHLPKGLRMALAATLLSMGCSVSYAAQELPEGFTLLADMAGLAANGTVTAGVINDSAQYADNATVYTFGSGNGGIQQITSDDINEKLTATDKSGYLTITCWVDPATVSGGHSIFAYGTQSDGFKTSLNGTNIRITTKRKADMDTSGGGYTADNWQFFAVSISLDGGASYCFNSTEGNPYATITTTGNWNAPSADNQKFGIGTGSSSAGWDGYTGSIANLQVFYSAEAASANTIAALTTAAPEMVSYTWAPTAESGTAWNTESMNWTKGGNQVAFASGGYAVFGSSAETKTVTVAENVSAGTMELNDSYTFDMQNAATVTAGSLKLAADKNITMTGSGTLHANTMSIGGNGTNTISLEKNTRLETGAALEFGPGRNLTTTGEGTLQIATLRSTGGDIMLNADTKVTGGGNGEGDGNNKLGLSMTSGGAQIRIKAGTTTVTGATYMSGTSGALRVGMDGVDAKLVTGRLELGDVNNSGASTLEIGSNGTLVVTSTNDDIDSYKNTGLLFSEWNHTTTANVSGNFFAKNVRLFSGDTKFNLNINNGGVVAVKGIAQAKTVANNITMSAGGKLVLGESGIAANDGNWVINLNGGEVGMSAASMTIAKNATLGGQVTFNTAQYVFSGESAAQKLTAGETAGAMTVSGVLSGSGSLVKTGNGTLTLSGANTYSGGTTISAGEMIVNNNDALGSGAVTLTGGKLTVSEGYSIANAVTVNGDAEISGSTDVTKMGIAAGKTATMTDGIATAGVTISGTAEKAVTVTNTGDSAITYSATEAAAKVTGDSLVADSESAVTVANKLEVKTISNTGSGDLLVTGAVSGLETLAAANGSITLQNAAPLSVSNLTLGAEKVVCIFSDAAGQTEGAITVTGKLTGGDGSELYADLVIADGATLDLASALTLHSMITVNGLFTLGGALADDLSTMTEGSVLTFIQGTNLQYAGEYNGADALNYLTNLDGVGTGDYIMIANETTFGVMMVPEPATATLSLLALAGLCARRRRH